MFKRFLSILGAWTCLGFHPVLAQSGNDAAPSAAAERPQGRWATSLAARGLAVSGSLTGLWIADVRGGEKTGGVYNSLGFANAEADLGRLTGWWRGGRAFVNGAWIRGGSVSSQFVGDALVVSNLDAFDSIRLYQWWLEQGVAGGRVALRAGCLSADEEFCCTEGGAMFTNSGFGWNAGIGGNVVNGGPIYYVPGLGVRVEAAPAEGWTARAGVYDGDSFDSPAGSPDPSEHGIHYQLTRAQGAFLIAETCHEWGGGGAGLAGALRLGAWRHTADFADNRFDASGIPFAWSGGDPAVHRGNHGGYAMLERKLWNEPADTEQGGGGWLRVAAAPSDRSAFSWVTEGGLRWTGLLPRRNADVLGVGVVTAQVSPAVRAQVRDANAYDGGARVVPDFERVVEAAYQMNFGGHWAVTPGAQWVQHPGTTREIRDAVVTTLRVTRQ